MVGTLLIEDIDVFQTLLITIFLHNLLFERFLHSSIIMTSASDDIEFFHTRMIKSFSHRVLFGEHFSLFSELQLP